MKSIIIICIVGLLPLLSFSNYLSDTTTTKNEITFSYDNSWYNSVNVKYARKISNKNWLKFGIGFHGDYIKNRPQVSTAYPTSSFNSSIAFYMGIDRHKSMSPKLEVIKGINIRYTNDMSIQKIDNPTLTEAQRRTITSEAYYGIGITYGLYYKISENFSCGSEFNPVILFDYSSNSTVKGLVVKMNLINISVISLRYKL